MSSKRKRASVTAALSFLVDAFPTAFTANPKLRQPLKVGIADDLASGSMAQYSRDTFGWP
jgi:sRNA-binding protein